MPRKSIFKKLPWVSLGLLLFTYGFFGWLLYPLHWKTWLIAAAFVLVLARALADPWTVIEISFSDLLKSRTLSFILIVLAAFGAVIILHWFSVSANGFLLLCTATLVRLDLQTSGFNRMQAFVILAIFCLAGLGLGLLIQHLLMLHRLF